MGILTKIVVLTPVLLFVGTLIGASTDGYNITNGDSINGAILVKLGRKINNPMLTLIGMAIQNLHKCEEWMEWSKCGVTFLRQFGVRTRNRTCTDTSGDQNGIVRQKTETDFGICEGNEEISPKTSCPRNYNLTANGFCMKLYTVGKSHKDADEQCQRDGGYLINVDSHEKYADVKLILTGGPVDTWVGGTRKGSEIAWTYPYGKNNTFYSDKWYRGYPRNSASYACLLLESNLWVDFGCDSVFPFLCEII